MQGGAVQNVNGMDAAAMNMNQQANAMAQAHIIQQAHAMVQQANATGNMQQQQQVPDVHMGGTMNTDAKCAEVTSSKGGKGGNSSGKGKYKGKGFGKQRDGRKGTGGVTSL